MKKDTGCNLYPSCLNCPLPECVEVISHNQIEKRTRDKEIKERFYKGENIEDLMKFFNVSKRTITRTIKIG